MAFLRIKSTEAESGSMLDLTTMLGAADCLGFIAETRELPPTRDLIITTAQFIETVVVQENLYLEEGLSPSWRPYMEVLDSITLESFTGDKVISCIPRGLGEERVTADTIAWALEEMKTLDPAVLRVAATARESCYRSVVVAKGINDKKTPFTDEYATTIQASGDLQLKKNYERMLRSLASRGIGFPGLNVVIRLRYFHEWLTTLPQLMYAPHFSRVPLVQGTLTKTERKVCFKKWSMRQLQETRNELLTDLTDLDERDALTFELSPIFVACLVGAKQPLDVLENALKLRDSRHARRFRKLCERLHPGADAMAPSEFQSRADAKRALDDLREVVVSKIGNMKASFKADPITPSVSGEIAFERAFTSANKNRSVIFLADTVRTSLQVMDTRARITQLFGDFADGNSKVLQRVPRKRVS